MAHPYRTRAERGPQLHACTDDAPACTDGHAQDRLIAGLLREQIALQNKLLWVNRGAVVAALLAGAVIGASFYHLGAKSKDAPAPREAERVELPPPLDDGRPRTAQLTSPPEGATPRRNRSSNAWIRATARANEAVLSAYERDDVVVHHVRLTARGGELLRSGSDLHTKMMPVALPNGETGIRLLRLSKSGWIEAIGLVAGDTLLRINGRALTKPESALEAYDEANRARHLVIEFEREGRTHVLSVTWNEGA